ncbi:hypothetical protein D3C74_50980 [compost metagenome]
MEEILNHIKDFIWDKHGIKVDSFYEEGKGVVFVPEGFLCIPRNVVATLTEKELLCWGVLKGVDIL